MSSRSVTFPLFFFPFAIPVLRLLAHPAFAPAPLFDALCALMLTPCAAPFFHAICLLRHGPPPRPLRLALAVPPPARRLSSAVAASSPVVAAGRKHARVPSPASPARPRSPNAECVPARAAVGAALGARAAPLPATVVATTENLVFVTPAAPPPAGSAGSDGAAEGRPGSPPPAGNVLLPRWRLTPAERHAIERAAAGRWSSPWRHMLGRVPSQAILLTLPRPSASTPSPSASPPRCLLCSPSAPVACTPIRGPHRYPPCAAPACARSCCSLRARTSRRR